MERYNELIASLIVAREHGELRPDIAKETIEQALTILRSMTKPDADPAMVEAMISESRAALHREFVVMN